MATRLASDVFDGFTAKTLVYTPPDQAYIACNPSVYFDGTAWRCLVRCINYRLGGHVPPHPNTQNAMLVLDKHQDMGVIRAHPMADLTGQPKSGYPISGFEDCRVFQWQGRLWATATCCHIPCKTTKKATGLRQIVLLEIDATYAFVSCKVLDGQWTQFYQKNWIPYVTPNDQLKLVYSIDRSIVIDVDHNRATSMRAWERGIQKSVGAIDWRAVGNHRGSSAAFRLPSGQLLVLAHGEGYQSRFMLLDGEHMRATHQTEMFNFRVVNEVEFAAGMAVDGQRVVCSYSVRDATVELGIFPMESVMQKMERIA